MPTELVVAVGRFHRRQRCQEGEVGALEMKILGWEAAAEVCLFIAGAVPNSETG
jgi:hypothetical protein